MTNNSVNDVSSAFSPLTSGFSPASTTPSTPSLDSLNDHVLLAIVSFVDTAKSVAALSKTCKRLHALVQNDGWRVFVQTRFSNLTVPQGTGHPWSGLADSLTWQTRCWDRRSVVLSNTDPNRGSRQGRQTVPFRPVLAAHMDHRDGIELVVCGAGENIEGRFRGRLHGPGRDVGVSWHHLPGTAHGYVAGIDDITALTLMEHGERGLCMVAGRAQGNLHVYSAARGDTFGKKICRLETADCGQAQNGSAGGTLESNIRNRDAEIRSVDVSKKGHFIVANTSKHVLLYRYQAEAVSNVDGDNELPTMKPLHIKNLANDGSSEKSLRDYPLLAAKFLSNDIIGVAKYGSLHYLNMTPTGLEGATVGKNIAHYKQLQCKSDTSIRAIEPVTSGSLAGGNFSLMLSSWHGGFIKLQDLRTPTPFDYVYRDSFDPYTTTMSLASYGTSHFLAGTEEGWLKIFDYRMPRPYYHVNGIPCSSRRPFPPPMSYTPPFPAKEEYPFPCNHVLGKQCRWHSQSQEAYYRPGFSLPVTKLAGQRHRGSGSHRTIWSLAKASDISPTFYFGLTGSVLEGNLFTYSDSTSRSQPKAAQACAHGRSHGDGREKNQGRGDPLFGFWEPRPAGKKARTNSDGTLFVESWDYSKYAHVVHPGTRNGEWARTIKASPPGTESPFGDIAKWHRLDDKYHSDIDYRRLVRASPLPLSILAEGVADGRV